MRVKVTSHFRDKLTREHYEVGEIVTLPEDRALDAVNKGCAEIVPEPKPKAKKRRKAKKAPQDKALRATENK